MTFLRLGASLVMENEPKSTYFLNGCKERLPHIKTERFLLLLVSGRYN
jgi:hypothetical protein